MNPRRLLKEITYGLAHAAGLTAIGKYLNPNNLVVLTYHSFGTTAEHPYINRMPITRFQEQLRHLGRHFELVSLEHGLEALQSSAPRTSERAMAAITVDDGYVDNYEQLYPVIRETGTPITIFLATDYLDSGRLPWPTRVMALLHFSTAEAITDPMTVSLATKNERRRAGQIMLRHMSRLGGYEREVTLQRLERALRPHNFRTLAPMTWAQVREMQSFGVQFGAHTHLHGWLDQLPTHEVDSELSVSRLRIESETGKPCRLLAYPNGNWTAAVADAAQRTGYDYALTQDAGVNTREELQPLALCRIEVPFNESLGTFACRVSGVALRRNVSA